MQSFIQRNYVLLSGLISCILVVLQQSTISKTTDPKVIGFGILLAVLGVVSNTWKGKGLSVTGLIGTAAGAIGTCLNNGQATWNEVIMASAIAVLMTASAGLNSLAPSTSNGSNATINNGTKVLILFACLLSFASCKITLVPAASPGVYQEVIDAAKATDNLYLSMESANDKRFATFQSSYVAVQSAINSIQQQDSLRKKSGVLLSQVQALKDKFQATMNKHQQSTVLNNTQLEIYRLQLAAYWKPVLVDEMNYK